MKQLQFGEWVIEVDIETTKEYYKHLSPSAHSQCYSNYSKYCETLSSEEKQFFESLGIDPCRCDVSTIGMDKDGTYPTFGSYCVIGRFLEKPVEILWTVEELKARDFVDDRPDHRLYIGKYQFAFLDPDSPFSEIPEEIPDNMIFIEFSAETIPWLLNEKCEQKLYYPAERWQLFKRIKEHFMLKNTSKDYSKQTEKDLLEILQNNNITFKKLSIKETKLYIQQWFDYFAPIDKKDEAQKLCFLVGRYRNMKFMSFLWHLFSAGLTFSEKESRAIEEYDAIDKGASVLLLQNEQIAFYIEDTKELTSKLVNEFNDIYITDKVFKWTYVHTHEEDCGPYFAYPPSAHN